MLAQGAVHKRRPQRRGVSSLDILRTRKRGFFRCRHSNFLVQKIRIFKIDGMSARTGWRGVEPGRKIFRQGQGTNFSQFCANVFYVTLNVQTSQSLFQYECINTPVSGCKCRLRYTGIKYENFFSMSSNALLF